MSAKFFRRLPRNSKCIWFFTRQFQNYHSLSFHYLLNTCSSISELQNVHARILTTGSHRNLQLSTKVFSLACSLSPSMDYARKIFDSISMPQRDVFAWNTLIRGYSDFGPCQQAIFLYRGMHGNGFRPDNYTFPFVIRSCAVISALWEGKEVHCNIIKAGFNSDVFVQSSLVKMYSQSGETLDSEVVFGEMVVRNIVSWTAMVAGYVRNGLCGKGLRLFREMVASGTQPNMVSLCGSLSTARSLFDQVPIRSLVSWNAMIAAYEQNNAAAEAIRLFSRMLCAKIEYDHITMVSVISACANLGKLNTGKWVHELARRRGFESHASVTNALIDMYAKCGNIAMAMDVFCRVPDKSVVSWTSIIGAFASHGHAEDALKLFQEMKQEGIQPNSLSYTAVLTACRHSGLVEEGKRVYDTMTRNYSLVPGLEQCACMVDLLGRAGKLVEALEFIENMPIEPDLGVWGALLSACKVHGDLKFGELVAGKMLQLNPQTVSIYALLVNIYAEAGSWEEVARLRRFMEQKELKKIPGQSLVEVNGKLYAFLSGSKSRSKPS